MEDKMNKESNVFEGDLEAEDGKVYQYTEVTGHIDTRENAKVSFPKLASVGGYIYTREKAKVSFPKLTSVGGGIYTSEKAKVSFPKLTSVGGGIYTYENAKVSFPKLTSVGGYIETYEKAKVSFPKLTSVGGGIDTHENAEASFPKLTSVGGGIYTYAKAKVSFPKLTSVGGDIDTHENAEASYPKAKENDPTAKQRCRAMLMASFALAGFSFADGILARAVSKRGQVTRVIVCGKTEISYLVTDGEAFSHGNTLREARDSLLYKIGSRDTTEFKSWKLSKKITKRDAIVAYRTITGACESGVRGWMEQHKVPESMTVKRAVEITKGAYGSDTFKQFFMAETK